MKAQGEVVTTVLIILLVLAAIVIVYQVVEKTISNDDNLFENITKEEFKIYKDYCWSETVTIPFYELPESGWLNGCSKADNSNNWICDFSLREECEAREVSEIDECGGSYLCREEPGCCLKYSVENDYLTTSWIEKNCEYDTISKLGVYTKDGVLYNYKCGEYYISVK